MTTDDQNQPVNNEAGKKQPVNNETHYQTYELVDLAQADAPVTQVVLMTAREAVEQNQRLLDAGSDQQWRTIRAPRLSTR